MTLYDPLTRSVPVAEIGFVDGNLEAVFVPWATPATVYDQLPDGTIDRYREAFRRGAFDAQIARGRYGDVALLPAHGATEQLGRTRSLADSDAGLHGVVAVYPSRRADVEMLVEEGIDTLSIEFYPMQKRARSDGSTDIRWRDAAQLQAVAFTATPAYQGAKVLALRSQLDAQLAADERAARMVELEAEIAALTAAGERWHS